GLRAATEAVGGGARLRVGTCTRLTLLVVTEAREQFRAALGRGASCDHGFCCACATNADERGGHQRGSRDKCESSNHGERILLGEASRLRAQRRDSPGGPNAVGRANLPPG